jgi:ADP-ribose pyrophosphatase YjhB (NUDIX family)
MSMLAPGVGVAGIIIGDDRRLLLARRANAPAAGLWAFPGGRVELGERLEDALRRELREECNIEVDILDRFEINEAIGLDPAGGGGLPREASDAQAGQEAKAVDDSPARAGLLHHWVIVQYRVSPKPGSRPAAGDDAAELRWFDLDALRALPTVPGLVALAARALRD